MNTGDTNTVIGKPLNRVDGHLKVTGGAPYATEFPVAKLTYGVTIQSTIAKGKIAQIDTKAAEQVPGVLAVTVMTQVAAEALGLPVNKVRFELGDTKVSVWR